MATKLIQPSSITLHFPDYSACSVELWSNCLGVSFFFDSLQFEVHCDLDLNCLSIEVRERITDSLKFSMIERDSSFSRGLRLPKYADDLVEFVCHLWKTSKDSFTDESGE